jgi:XTP/dITP diphosphohydrolase
LKKIPIHYVTSSKFKRDENGVFLAHAQLKDGRRVCDVFDFHIREATITEVLEVDLRVLVQNEVAKAYQQVKVPCIVEHAGLIFEEYLAKSYPGGLTKPMWNALGEEFVRETQSAGRRAVARAVIGYCDGKSIHTFVGETRGTIANEPRGDRKFYWDTVFIPDVEDADISGKTYSEIVHDPRFGLKYKLQSLSQSSRAMLAFLEFRLVQNAELWQG